MYVVKYDLPWVIFVKNDIIKKLIIIYFIILLFFVDLSNDNIANTINTNPIIPVAYMKYKYVLSINDSTPSAADVIPNSFKGIIKFKIPAFSFNWLQNLTLSFKLNNKLGLIKIINNTNIAPTISDTIYIFFLVSFGYFDIISISNINNAIKSGVLLVDKNKLPIFSPINIVLYFISVFNININDTKQYTPKIALFPVTLGVLNNFPCSHIFILDTGSVP